METLPRLVRGSRSRRYVPIPLGKAGTTTILSKTMGGDLTTNTYPEEPLEKSDRKSTLLSESYYIENENDLDYTTKRIRLLLKKIGSTKKENPRR